MNIDVPAPLLVGAALTGAIAATGAIVRALVLDRIKALEVGLKGQGERFGENIKDIEKWQAGHDKVEAERERVRRRADTRGVPIPNDEP